MYFNLQAPENVQNLLASIPTSSVQRVPLSKEVIELRNAYIAAGILGVKWADDATHVAFGNPSTRASSPRGGSLLRHVPNYLSSIEFAPHNRTD